MAAQAYASNENSLETEPSATSFTLSLSPLVCFPWKRIYTPRDTNRHKHIATATAQNDKSKIGCSIYMH